MTPASFQSSYDLDTWGFLFAAGKSLWLYQKVFAVPKSVCCTKKCLLYQKVFAVPKSYQGINDVWRCGWCYINHLRGLFGGVMEKPAVTPMYSPLPLDLMDADTYAIHIVQQGLLNSSVPTPPLQYIPLDRYRQKASDKALSDEARVKAKQLEQSADQMDLLAKALREDRPHHRIVSPLFRDSPGFTRPTPPKGRAETVAESLLSDARAAIAELNAIIPSLPTHKRERAARALESLDQCHEQLLAGRE